MITNGARFVSATAAIMNRMKASGCERMNQFGRVSGPSCRSADCCSMIWRTLSDWESMKMPTRDRPSTIS
jgi:hypothetical protein